MALDISEGSLLLVLKPHLVELIELIDDLGKLLLVDALMLLFLLFRSLRMEDQDGLDGVDVESVHQLTLITVNISKSDTLIHLRELFHHSFETLTGLIPRGPKQYSYWFIGHLLFKFLKLLLCIQLKEC